MRHGETQVLPVTSGPDRLRTPGHEDRHIDPPQLQSATVGGCPWPRRTGEARSSAEARWDLKVFAENSVLRR